jgi:hypothetical protein
LFAEEGLFLEVFEKPSNLFLDINWIKKKTKYDNVHKFLEAMPKFVWTQKLCEGQVVMQCS